MKRYYPIFVDLAGHTCLVAGGGDVAARKAAGLREAGAVVTIVAPQVCADARNAAARVIERRFQADDLDGVRLAIAATDDGETNRSVAEEAARRGILCNVADAPEMSGFILPAVLRRGRLTVAVSTGGASPAAAREIRDEIGRALGEDAAAHLEFLARARGRVKAEKADSAVRRRILERLARPDVRDMIAGRGVEAAEEMLRELMGREPGG